MLLGAALAGCNESPPVPHFDRETYRMDAISTCSTGMQMGGATSTVANRICGCGIQRFMAGKTDIQIDAMTEEQQRQGNRAAVQYCLDREDDFGPAPTEPPSSAPSNSGQEISPAPSGAPGAGSGAEAGQVESSVEQRRRREAEDALRAVEAAGPTAETPSAPGNETAGTRWRQTPPR